MKKQQFSVKELFFKRQLSIKDSLIAGVVVLLVYWILLSVCSAPQSKGLSDKNAQQDGIRAVDMSKFEGHGYFKQNRNKIKTVVMKGQVTEEEALGYGKNTMNTPGRLTAVYFYKQGSVVPNDRLTLSRDVFSANDVLYEGFGYSKWKYAYMKAVTGEEIFVDCEKEPLNALCRS